MGPTEEEITQAALQGAEMSGVIWDRLELALTRDDLVLLASLTACAQQCGCLVSEVVNLKRRVGVDCFGFQRGDCYAGIYKVDSLRAAPYALVAQGSGSRQGHWNIARQPDGFVAAYRDSVRFGTYEQLDGAMLAISVVKSALLQPSATNALEQENR